MGKNYNKPNNRFIKKHWQTILIFVLLVSNIAVYFGVKQEPYVDPGVEYRKTYNLLDGNRRLADEKNLITNIQPLREYLRGLSAQNKDWADISIYFEYLPTGANITVNQDLQIWPASLAKLPLAIVVMKRVESGQWSLDTRLEMTAEDADTVRTPDITQDIGKSYDIKFLLERLLLESDNTAYRMLLKNFTEQELNDIGTAIGLEQFFSEGGKVSAKDYSRLFRVLYLAAYVNEEHSQFLLRLLQDSEFKNFIKAGLPAEVPYAHKWGTNLAIDVFADAGIVYVEGRPYMISVMIQGKGESSDVNQQKAGQLMKEIGQKTYEFISSR